MVGGAQLMSQEIEKEMDQLIQDGAFIRSDSKEVILSPVFLIPKKSGGSRMIHDLRGINAHIRAPHFTLRGAKDAATVVRDSRWLCALDLQRGYQQVYMDLEARRYLGAQHRGETVVSAVLPSAFHSAHTYLPG